MNKTEIFIDKARKVHGNKYDYSKTIYIHSQMKVCIIYNGREFWQTPHAHLKGQTSMFEAVERRKKALCRTKDDFVNRALQVHKGTYGYDKSKYVNKRTKLLITDLILNEDFWQTPDCHLRGKGNPSRRNNISKISLTWLLSIDPEQKFITPYAEPSLIINGRKRKMDGYDPKTNTVYQFHGSYWHGFNGKEITDQGRYEETMRRDNDIRNSGYNLLVMWEHDWYPTEEDKIRVPERSVYQ